MQRTWKSVVGLVAAAALAASMILGTAGVALASDYGPGAVYQVELTANIGGHNGGGVWLWIALYPDGSGDYQGADCGHGSGAARDHGDVAWSSDGTTVTITGVVLNGFGGFLTTISVPATYGHYSGTIGSFLTLPGIPAFIGTSQLQVAP
jgi:hypothetical protein